MMNKRGAELAIGTIIVIVLGLIVLVVVALGFTQGWQNLWEKVNVFAGGSSLSTVGQACQIACAANDQTGFCAQGRDIKKLSDTNAGVLGLASGVNKIEGVTCRTLVDKKLISGCPEVSCAGFGECKADGNVVSNIADKAACNNLCAWTASSSECKADGNVVSNIADKAACDNLCVFS